MILTCPECSTHYKAKDGAIGPNGRTVHCGKCDATWFEPGRVADPDELALEDNKAVVIEADDDPLPATQAELELEAPVGAHVALRDRADAQKLKRRNRFILIIWLVTIAILIVAAILAFLNRQAIVNRTPIAASAYKTVGVTVKQGGLDIAPPETETLLVEGEPVLFVRTSVENMTDQARAAPFLGFRLHNRSGEAVAEWYVEPGSVRAGEVKNVDSSFPNPPVDGVQLSYGFAEE